MNDLLPTRRAGGFLPAITMVVVTSVLVADSPAPPEPSSYAPIQDVNNQVDYFLKRIGRDLKDAEDFGEDQAGRIQKDASTLAVLALVLANHDKDSERKPAAGLLLEAAKELAGSASDFDQAQAAWTRLQRALESTGPGRAVTWEPVADLATLMQQVPIVNNSLRRGVNGRRFKRSVDKTAGLAATLAALAQASSLDTGYCSDQEEEVLWREICAQLRDSAAEVNAAVRAGDQEAAKAALAKSVQSCDACHHRFRD